MPTGSWLLFTSSMARGSLDTEILWAFSLVSFITYQQKFTRIYVFNVLVVKRVKYKALNYLFICFQGRELYYITWVFQYLTILLGNMGFILLGGKALKVINNFKHSTLLVFVY